MNTNIERFLRRKSTLMILGNHVVLSDLHHVIIIWESEVKKST